MGLTVKQIYEWAVENELIDLKEKIEKSIKKHKLSFEDDEMKLWLLKPSEYRGDEKDSCKRFHVAINPEDISNAIISENEEDLRKFEKIKDYFIYKNIAAKDSKEACEKVLYILAYTLTCPSVNFEGIVVDEGKANTSRCKRIPEIGLVFNRGIIGPLNKEQVSKFCKEKFQDIEMTEKAKENLERFKSTVNICKEKTKGEHGTKRLIAYINCMRKKH